MEWRDEGIILGARRHGETSIILEVMTRDHGRHLGLVRGGRSRRMQPMIQPGNRVDVVWRARMDEHLGMMQVEPVNFAAARLIEQPVALFGLQLAASHLRLLPERDPHRNLFETLAVILEHSEDSLVAGELLLRFEIAMLEELGFGLDLRRCAATGSAEDLAYVSPKSGRAVSREAGAPWAEKLLAMPAFMVSTNVRAASLPELVDAFRLTAFFFSRHVWEPRAQKPPEARDGFLNALARSLQAA
ncbi:DNA repair protein RecO [Phyllobacterium sp. 0TCS1.6C]|jgi:DNA repair protein RecO (recombination protein O)|uniref:DNA repair protein RecO n=1 Tax=unclassified Phyllobacterium TaxID=2638441 RepID=UPI0022656812|nr:MULTISPECIES: DNA repair protein RecO [unclassified Phyllobacterium]MCX8280554.1 DNA repair protein RecO [Phyllobacterium sp. 0TCS1.6C]MCX8294997.1 DNA repair protein RecO [Phyllobacterium sp. 0TCS1.6A]